MYEYIRGRLTECTPTYAVIEAGQIGYLINISLPAYEELQKRNDEVKMLIHEIIREDAHILYGFLHEEERELFRLLIGVSGVGPNTAALILSSLPIAELKAVINSGDHLRLKNVKGIGLKTAQRIIVDLKDKIKPGDSALFLQSASVSADNEVYQEALAALTALGFSRPQSQKTLNKIFDTDPSVKVEAAIRKALSMM